MIFRDGVNGLAFLSNQQRASTFNKSGIDHNDSRLGVDVAASMKSPSSTPKSYAVLCKLQFWNQVLSAH